MPNIPRPGSEMVDVSEAEFRAAIAACPGCRYGRIAGVGLPDAWTVLDDKGDLLGIYAPGHEARDGRPARPDRYTLLR